MTKGKILIVEDETLVAQQIEEELQGVGYEVVSQVSYGEKVLDEVKKCHPDLVLMDIMLKGEINGIEAARQLKSCSDVPVVFLTAYGDRQMFERASQTEPYGFLTKPYRPQELNAAIAIGLNRNKSETNLRIREHFYRDIVEKSEDIIFMLDPEKTITYANPAFRFLGYDLSELIGKPIETLIASDNMPGIVGVLATKGVGPLGTFDLEVCIKANEESAISEHVPVQRFSINSKGLYEGEPNAIQDLNFSFKRNEGSGISAQPPVQKFSIDALGLWDVPEETVFTEEAGKKFLGTLCMGRKID
ncbi:MAG: response regulator [Nitrospina sp.]|nr:response regulator [Nitrospina sp.]